MGSSFVQQLRADKLGEPPPLDSAEQDLGAAFPGRKGKISFHESHGSNGGGLV